MQTQMQALSPEALKPQLTSGQEIAFLDVREHGQYGEGHPFFCVNVPYSVLEARAAVLLPCKQVPIVLMDDNDGVAQKAATILARSGCTNVRVLEAGVPAWQAAGYNLFKGVNVPSKTFGELVEHRTGTPSISAEELQTRLANSDDLIILDGRSPAEFTAMSLPSAQSCPNAELAYRAPQLFHDAETTVIINCAGRTRSIIGAESLRQFGLKNPVYALRNGTQGWRLAGFDLNHGEAPGRLPLLTPAQLQDHRHKAKQLAKQQKIDIITPSTLESWQSETSRTTYLLDVRTAEEFAAAHWPGARHAPGGQLVQATDEFVAVRGARLVLCDDTGLRAALTAIWLAGMNHNVSVLDADVSTAVGPADLPPSLHVNAPLVSAEQAAVMVTQGAVLLDVSRGMDFRKAHPKAATWVTRSRLARLDCPSDATIIVTGGNRSLVAGVVTDLAAAGYGAIHWLEGTQDVWLKAGFTLEATPDSPSESECIDFLFFVHDRHADNLDAARQYLAWETGLLAQLDDQERNVLSPPPPADRH